MSTHDDPNEPLRADQGEAYSELMAEIRLQVFGLREELKKKDAEIERLKAEIRRLENHRE